MNARSRQTLLLELARHAREASLRPGACAPDWRDLRAALAERLATSPLLDSIALHALASTGDDDTVIEGDELLDAIRSALDADRDFRGHLSIAALLLEDLARFERALEARAARGAA